MKKSNISKLIVAGLIATSVTAYTGVNNHTYAAPTMEDTVKQLKADISKTNIQMTEVNNEINNRIDSVVKDQSAVDN